MNGAATFRDAITNGVELRLMESWGHETESWIKRQADIISECVPWDIGNVVAYIDSVYQENQKMVGWPDIPCALPQFGALWIEGNTPSWTRTLSSAFASAIPRFGWALQTFDVKAIKEKTPDFTVDKDMFPGEPRFVTTASLFFHHAQVLSGRTHVSGPHVQMSIALNDNGDFLNKNDNFIRLIPTSHLMVTMQDTERKEFGEESAKDMLDTLASSFGIPAFFAISLAHCSNVGQVEQQGRYASRQERRLAERRGDPPPHKYYTLEIGGMTKHLNGEGNAKRDGLQRAMHICRGHFSTYTEDKPLFGKYSGRFWVPAHVRGSSDAGRIIKDYRVNAPKGGVA